jgi:hypothetical protein
MLNPAFWCAFGRHGTAAMQRHQEKIYAVEKVTRQAQYGLQLGFKRASQCAQ